MKKSAEKAAMPACREEDLLRSTGTVADFVPSPMV